jgi:predicted Co/Zn/Cd cation transporter (cation efflux family)
MNESEWSELQRLWKSSPPAEPVIAELDRLRRRQRWLAVGIAAETIIAVAGLIAGVALIARGGLFFVVAGGATCVFVAVVCALSLWVWRLPQPRPEDAVEHAVAVARQNARIGVRHATATIWALVVGMVFSAVMALARGLLTENAALAGYVAIGAVQLGMAAWFALAFRYYQARSAALARLEAIAAALEQ